MAHLHNDHTWVHNWFDVLQWNLRSLGLILAIQPYLIPHEKFLALRNTQRNTQSLERLNALDSSRLLRQLSKLEPVPEKSDNIRNENPQPMDSQVHRLKDKCHRHDNGLTEGYRGKKYNTREHPTGMDSTPAKVS
ncbi:hypothetical protein PIB30_077598 [Stylosanthes scabra]|uniref:Uncharacterized protein n=1 Tax=Stylosanthes scabra TaxID=79078 RepID=A0ABU6XQ90_9FABA|nr:hypothetical protein [Stylosanthes scabra]